MSLLGVQVQEMKSMSNAIRNLEGSSKFSVLKLLTVHYYDKKGLVTHNCYPSWCF